MKWLLDNEEWNTWECSECGILWQFIDGTTPEDNQAYFCPGCGAHLIRGKNYKRIDKE
jgi:predicted RNA-binding Zn-ribbon protein involved in translation (DUF1610 family)